MKKKIAVLVFLVLGIILFAILFFKAGWKEIWTILQGITWWNLLLFFLLIQISGLLFTLRWQMILKTHGYTVPFWKIWFYRLTGYGISYITPTPVGGEPARIYFLHENHGVPLSEATASVYFDKLLELTIFVFFIAAGVVVGSFSNLLPDRSMTLALIFIGCCLFFFSYIFKKLLDHSGFFTTLFRKFHIHRFKGWARYEEKIYQMEKLISNFLSHTDHQKKTLPILVFLTLVGWGITIVEYYFIAKILGISLTPAQSFFISTIPSFAYMLPVPGGLGLLEGFQTALFTLFGYTSGMALAVVVLVRVKELFFSGIGFLYAVTHGLTLLGRKKPFPEKHDSNEDHEQKEDYHGH